MSPTRDDRPDDAAIDRVMQAVGDEDYREQWIRDAIGQPEAVVRAAVAEGGGVFAVIERDGRHFATTRNLNMNRVNVRITRGVVTDAHYG